MLGTAKWLGPLFFFLGLLPLNDLSLTVWIRGRRGTFWFIIIGWFSARRPWHYDSIFHDDTPWPVLIFGNHLFQVQSLYSSGDAMNQAIWFLMKPISVACYHCRGEVLRHVTCCHSVTNDWSKKMGRDTRQPISHPSLWTRGRKMSPIIAGMWRPDDCSVQLQLAHHRPSNIQRLAGVLQLKWVKFGT